ncbi:MAG: hypothetical protein A2Y77_09995 [Planctomycetes bacterium RBG_13_62_9]|nr:MAG: hypothetical protein A2Y77_09995 [Planctomycetes bacterium RBG_13_62_9]
MRGSRGKLSNVRRLNGKWLGLLFLSLLGAAFLWDCTGSVVQSIAARPPALAEGDRICLSLRVLASEAQADSRLDRPLRAEVETLAGMNWVEGFVVDRDNKDVILIGRCDPDRPPLYLDDLAVNIRNVWNAGAYPYCSLDPRPEDVLKTHRILSESTDAGDAEDLRRLFSRLKENVGPQQIVVGGIPRDSRQAHVMIEADYHMKQVSQGHVEVPGVASCLDRSLERSRQAVRHGGQLCGPQLSMSRYWFHLDEGDPTFVESHGIVYLDRCSVVVLTERQKATADGELYDEGGSDPLAFAFAQEFSRAFREAAARVPVYADLEHLYRLNALVRAMHFRQAPEQAGLDLQFYLARYRFRREETMPADKPGLANSREVAERVSRGATLHEYVLSPMICGGVSMDTAVRSAQFQWRSAGWLAHARSVVAKARPHANSLCWTLPRHHMPSTMADGLTSPATHRRWSKASTQGILLSWQYVVSPVWTPGDRCRYEIG